MTEGWSDDDSRAFIVCGTVFVPGREHQIETVCTAIPRPSGPCCLVDLCCGEGLISRALLEAFPEARVLALDGSPAMVEGARTALAGHGDRFAAEPFDLAASEWRDLPARSDGLPIHAVVSSLAIHHLDGAQKQTLYRDMARVLAPRGALVIADLIQPTTDEGVGLAARAWDESARQRSLDLTGKLDAYEQFVERHWNYYADPDPDPIDRPSPLFDQLKWLEQAGLTGIDVFWMTAGHAVFGGYKPAS